MANLGWDELLREGFPLLNELNPDAHRPLLERIERAARRLLHRPRTATKVPPLFLPNWQQWPQSLWPDLHAYALVRRLFDSLEFLTGALRRRTPGMTFVPLALQVRPAKAHRGLSRVPDFFEEFLHELDDCDLGRIRACPVCHRFFIAWRDDQKACRLRCANLVRILRFRGKLSA